MQRNKYNNIKTTVLGVGFDSKKEGRRYAELLLLQRAGEISDLQMQVRIRLQDSFKDLEGHKHRPIDYLADFIYVDKSGDVIIEDVKGMATPVYKLKKKLLLKKYDYYKFREV